MTNDQKRQIRHAVREVLVARHPIALSVPNIRRKIQQEKWLDFQFEEEDVNAALMLLLGLTPPQIEIVPEELGVPREVRATSAGVLAHERGSLN